MGTGDKDTKVTEDNSDDESSYSHEGEIVPIEEEGTEETSEGEEDVQTPTSAPKPEPFKQPPLMQLNISANVPWSVEKDCLLLLLEARMVLREMIEHKLKEERIQLGNLGVDEIQNLLRSQKEDTDVDWIAEIQELKRNLVQEVRRNHTLEAELGKVDKRIALLIKNRGNIQEELATTSKKKHSEHKRPDLISEPKKIELYQNLFYLLQTDPRYLANVVFLVGNEQMTSFLDTVILTLFGDAFSPREEFLILSLFKLAMIKELTHLGAVGDLLSAETVVIKMVLAYNKRKQGSEYLKSTLGSLLQSAVKQDQSLEMRPLAVYQAMINEREIRTGEKSTLERNLPEDKILDLPEVQAILKTRAETLLGMVKQFFEAIVTSLPRLPYGMRWICKQIQQIAAEKFPNSTQAEILRVTGYFIYYRFINVMIVQPAEFKVVDVRDITVLSTKNLVAVAKVLQQLFSLSTFSEKYMQPVNDWLSVNMDRTKQYLEELLDVPDPEDYLRVDRYVELTQKTKPVIIISLHEIASTHSLIHKHLESLGLEKDDPLRIIARELDAFGPIPDISKEDDREMQLTLVSRFETQVDEETNADQTMFAETKELTITALRGIPVEPRSGDQAPSFSETLTRGLAFADKTNNSALHTTIVKVQDNLKKLEERGLVSSTDNFASFLRAVALEVANRQAIREQQKKEVRRLEATLKNLRSHQQYINDQIKHYQDYLQDCKAKQSGKKQKKTSTQQKKFKFTYAQLKKKGVITEADAAHKSTVKRLDFVIYSEKAGVFVVVAKLGPAEVQRVEIEMDDLLERRDNAIQNLELDEITLNVNMTIYLLNKLLMK